MSLIPFAPFFTADFLALLPRSRTLGKPGRLLRHPLRESPAAPSPALRPLVIGHVLLHRHARNGAADRFHQNRVAGFPRSTRHSSWPPEIPNLGARPPSQACPRPAVKLAPCQRYRKVCACELYIESQGRRQRSSAWRLGAIPGGFG